MIDFMTRTSSVEEMIDYLQRRILWDLKKAYGQLECFDWNDLAEFTGFTEAEVQELCQQYDMPYDKTKQWYDGYDLKGIQIYNPRSVVMSMLGHDYDSYWTKTETYEALKKYIQMNQYGLIETEMINK